MLKKDIKIHALHYDDDLLASIDDDVLEICEEIHLMPDTHIGLSVPIGFVGKLKGEKIIPNMVGVDIGCGMLSLKIPKSFHRFDLKKLNQSIQRAVPTGFNIRKTAVHKEKTDRILKNITMKTDGKSYDRYVKSIGTLGGGNHFIELNETDTDYYLVIHSGSRNLGHQVCTYHQNKINKKEKFLENDKFHNYVNDMNLVIEYAKLNRQTMMEKILLEYNADLYHQIDMSETIDVIHNYYDEERNIVFKGAISAKEDEDIIIPINMRDGSIFAKGKGNREWLSAAPHGAGRVLSRTEAKKKFDVSSLQKEMSSVYSTTLSGRTIDEHPDAYRTIDEILKTIQPTAKDIVIAKPILNYKG